MKALQRWRNSNSDGAVESRRQRNVAKGSAISSSTHLDGLTSGSKSMTAQQYNDVPQDILYPTNATATAGNSPRLGAISSSSRSTLDQFNGSEAYMRKHRSVQNGEAFKQSDRHVEHKSIGAGFRRLSPSNSTDTSGRIHSDPLIGRSAAAPAARDWTIKNTNRKDRKRSTLWNHPARALSHSKANAELPADLVSLPKQRPDQAANSDNSGMPVFVVSKPSSPTASQNCVAPALSAPPSTSSFRTPIVSGSGSNRVDNSASKSYQTATSINKLPDTRQHITKSPAMNGFRRSSGPEHSKTLGNMASSSSSQDSNALHTTLRHNTGAASPLSSAPSSPDPPMLPHSSSSNGAAAWDNSKAASSDMLRSPSTFSLRSARSRLSGLLGAWNRSTAGLNATQIPHNMSVTSNDSETAEQPSIEPSRSQILAHNLNELAVAFEEGLLGEEDYRMLRKGVFDKMVQQGGMEVPRESSLRASQSASLPSTAGQGDDASSYVAGSIPSKVSDKARAKSLSRSRSQRSHQTHTAKAQASDRSILSSVGSFGGLSRPRHEKQQILQEQYSHARRAKTLRGSASMNMLEAFNERESGGGLSAAAEKHEPPSRMASSSGASAFTNFSTGGLSVSGGTALLARDYVDKSSEQIEAEIAVVEAEGQRIVDKFKTLEVHAIGRQKLSFEQIRRAIANVEGELATFAGRPSQIVATPTQQPSRNRPDATRMDLFGKLRTDATPLDKARKDPTPSSFFRSDAQSAPAAMTSTPMASQQQRQRQDKQNDWKSADEDDAEVRRLQHDLQEIHRRRAEVTTKYEDRLAFLRSTLRSAKIREGLR